VNQAPLFWPRQLVVDLFAGGAGASTGLAQAIGRSVDIAVDHDPEAMMVHRANHPETMHYGGDVFDIEPRKVVRGQRVWILWASPSCTTHSRARTKEGPLDQQSRTGGDVVVRWAREVLVKFGYTHLVTKGYGEHKTQPPRAMDVDAPLTTIVASGVKHQVVTAFIAKHFGGKGSPGSSIDAPLGAITTKDHNALVVGRRETSAERREATRAWLDHYVGKGAFPEIEDIVMRALTPRELFNCQGFPHDYIIDPKVRGKGLSPTSQVRLVGNSVPPTMARVVVKANIATEMGEVAA